MLHSHILLCLTFFKKISMFPSKQGWQPGRPGVWGSGEQGRVGLAASSLCLCPHGIQSCSSPSCRFTLHFWLKTSASCETEQPLCSPAPYWPSIFVGSCQTATELRVIEFSCPRVKHWWENTICGGFPTWSLLPLGGRVLGCDSALCS